MEKYYTEKLNTPTQIGFSDKLPYKCFVDDGIIYHEDAQFTFQKSYWFDGIDFESIDDNITHSAVEYLNILFAGMQTGWVLSVNNIRMRDNGYLDTTKNHFDNELLQTLDREREYFFTKQANIFKSVTVLTLTHTAQNKSMRRIGEWFKTTNKVATPPKTFDLTLADFKLQINQLTKLMDRVIKLRPMTDDETVSYLNCLISGKWINFKLPTKTYVDLRFLLGDDYISGLEPKIGDKHVRIIAIDNYFPDESEPLMLERLNTLGFEFRWNTRFFFLTKLEAQKNIDYISDLHEQNISGIKGAAMSGSGMESRKYNRGAEYLFEEAEEARASTMISNLNYGKYSCNIVLHHEDENEVKRRCEIVITTLEEMGFKTRNETINSEEAFLSTIDGNIYKNKRRSLISTENLADLLPISGFWHGLDNHPSQLYPEKSNSMFMVDCNGYQRFKGNLFSHDMGHTLIIGRNGAGKSTLANFLISSHMRYQNAQFFGLDNKHSMLPLTYGVNGAHYDLGIDNTSFQPLADIDTIRGYDFAVDWLGTLCEVNHVDVTTDISKAIRGILDNLSVQDREYRTMENLCHYAQGCASQQLADVIQLYTGTTTMQALILGDNQDRISLNNFNVFELSELINKGEKALVPVLKYIFYKIMGKLDGRPTLILIEEAWMAFNSPAFSKQLDEWLKTLRKLNVYIVMVTLQIGEILNSPIKTTLLTQCATRLYTPNPDLDSQEVYDTYKEFGLNNKQIEILKNAKMKSEYYISNNDGDRLFNLDMTYFDIARCFLSKTSKDDIMMAKKLKAQNNDNFVNKWLENFRVSL